MHHGDVTLNFYRFYHRRRRRRRYMNAFGMKMMARHTTDSEKVNLLLVCRVAYEVKQIPGIKI